MSLIHIIHAVIQCTKVRYDLKVNNLNYIFKNVPLNFNYDKKKFVKKYPGDTPIEISP